MKFEFKSGLIYVPISVHYNKSIIDIQAAIDTGSAGTAVDINLVKLDLSRKTRIADIVGIGGWQQVAIQEAEKVIIGDESTLNFQIEFADLKDTFGVDAFIGSDLLKKLNAVIDFSVEELRFI